MYIFLTLEFALKNYNWYRCLHLFHSGYMKITELGNGPEFDVSAPPTFVTEIQTNLKV